MTAAAGERSEDESNRPDEESEATTEERTDEDAVSVEEQSEQSFPASDPPSY